jgi:hypothetical protein
MAAMSPADEPELEGQPGAANDNGSADGPDPEALRKVHEVILKLARIIGRQMAREDFAARVAKAANDNTPEEKNERLDGLRIIRIICVIRKDENGTGNRPGISAPVRRVPAQGAA